MLLAELEIVLQHVGQAGGVREQMDDANVLLAVLSKGGYELGDAVLQPDLTALDQHHGSRRGDRLGDRRDQEQRVLAQRRRIGFGPLLAEETRLNDAAVAANADARGRNAIGLDPALQQRVGALQPRGIDVDRLRRGDLEVRHGGYLMQNKSQKTKHKDQTINPKSQNTRPEQIPNSKSQGRRRVGLSFSDWVFGFVCFL